MGKKTIWKTAAEDSPRKPPPNYFSRRMQTRLLILVGSFMLVILLFGLAANPDTWKRLFPPEDSSLVGGAPLSEQETTEEEFDTTLPGGQTRTTQPQGAITAPRMELQLELLDDDEGGVNKAGNVAWQQFLEQVSEEDRRLMRKVLYDYRHGQPPSDEEKREWPQVVEHLAARWERYLQKAELNVQRDPDLAPEDKGRWVSVLDQLQKTWAKHEYPAMLAVVDPDGMTDEQRQDLERLQQRFDQLSLAAVKDDAVHRPEEFDAWFRLLELLQQAPSEELSENSQGRVGFQQLFKQSDAYRGQLVTVRGHARLAYYVRAPRNNNGVEGYYVFWLHPVGGPQSPVVVYALETPPGFPIAAGGTSTASLQMNEPMEFTGYFFKRWAYKAADDIRVAPLLLAKIGLWQPEVEAEPTKLPSLSLALAAVLLVGGLAVGLSVLVYTMSKAVPSADKYSPVARSRGDQLNKIDVEQIDPTQVLRELAEQEDPDPR